MSPVSCCELYKDDQDAVPPGCLRPVEDGLENSSAVRRADEKGARTEDSA